LNSDLSTQHNIIESPKTEIVITEAHPSTSSITLQPSISIPPTSSSPSLVISIPPELSFQSSANVIPSSPSVSSPCVASSNEKTRKFFVEFKEKKYPVNMNDEFTFEELKAKVCQKVKHSDPETLELEYWESSQDSFCVLCDLEDLPLDCQRLKATVD
jgi:hypothetical protein